MAGRKSIYSPETLEIGQKIAITGKKKQFAKQTAYNFTQRKALKGRIFRAIRDNGDVWIERVA